MEDIKKEVEQAVNLYKSGNFSESEVLSKKLINKNPNIPFLYNLLGLIFSGQKKYEDAIKIYEKGLKIKPDYAMIYNNLGTIYKSKKDYKKAEDLYNKSINLNGNISETRNNLGNLYIDLENYDDAIKSFKRSIEINPKFYIAYYNLGILYKNLGQFDESKKYLKESIKLNSNFYQAHRAYSQIYKYKKEDDHINVMENLYKLIDNDSLGKIELSFSLGKAFDDIKDFNKASKYYDHGNKIRRKSIYFSKEKEKREFSDIINFFKNKNLKKVDQSYSNKNDSTIFILGMPRSGTTLVEQIISNHSKVIGGGELIFFDDLVKNNFFKNNLLNSDEIDNTSLRKKVADEYIKKIKEISKEKKFITDKLPINFKWIGFIKLLLPQSKIIHCTRNSKDTCLSIYKNYFTNSKLNYAYNFDELIYFYNLYSKLMSFWKKKLGNDFIEVKYEKLIKEPKKIIPIIIRDCKLNWEQNCLEFHENKRMIKTASDVQARNKIYSSSINSWKNYKTYYKSLSKLKV